MKRRGWWVVVGLMLCALGGWTESARAATEVSTIYLQNGGKLRGEIVIDVPGAPLTVMVAGQAIQVPRETIARIESAPSAPDQATAGSAVAMPVAAAPMYAAPVQPAPAMMPAPAAPSGPFVLRFDRRGRAAIEPTWSPELQQLVQQRNDVAYSVRRKGLGAPIAMLSLGAVVTITTAVATTIAANNYANCLADNVYDTYSYETCEDRTAIGMGIGYSIGSALLAGGTTFLVVRIVRKKSLRRKLAMIDQNLARYNVAPMAKLNSLGGMAGLSLRARF